MTLNDLQYAVTKAVAYQIDCFEAFTRLIYVKTPSSDFSIQNIHKIEEEISTNIKIIYRRDPDRPIYNVKPRFTKSIWISLNDDVEPNQIIRDFEVLNSVELPLSCGITSSCLYSGRRDNLKRHEKTCTDEQTTITQQKPYGKDSSTINRLIDLGHLPKEASTYRKTFFTSFDIESLEDKSNAESMKNVVAVHKIVSIAVSTNQGHSRCFVRENSTHRAVVEMFEAVLNFLEEINRDYLVTIPHYFHECIENLEVMCNDESSLPKKQKMELCMLKSKLSNYVIQDVFGFNSGMFSDFFFIVY